MTEQEYEAYMERKRKDFERYDREASGRKKTRTKNNRKKPKRRRK